MEKTTYVRLVGIPRKMSGIRRYADSLISGLLLNGVGVNNPFEEPDVTHYVSPTAFKRRRGESVVTIHDLAPINMANNSSADYSSIRGRAYRWFFRKAVERCFKGADVVIATSTQTARECYEEFGVKPEVVCPAVPEKFAPYVSNNSDIPRIGMLCRDGVGRFLKIVARLQSAGLHARFIVGGELPHRFSDYPMVDSLGWIHEDQIVHFYNSLDYFIHPSMYEGFGYPILEARACGVNVIAFRKARIPDEVKRFAIQVENEEEAVEKILLEAKQPRTEIPFTPEKMGAEMLAIYKKALE